MEGRRGEEEKGRKVGVAKIPLEASSKAVMPKCASASPHGLATCMMLWWGKVGEREEKRERMEK